jgi:hypothetical protein
MLSKPVLNLATPYTQPAASETQAVTPLGDLSKVVVNSNPAGADITIDGGYVGSTPSTLRLKPGRHTITVEKATFKPWQRNLNVDSDSSVSVEANLEKGI